MQTVAVIGASRGIGLELSRQYAADGWRVHATSRTPHTPGALGELGGDVNVHPLDVRNRHEIDALARALAEQPIDVLVHNAGIMGGAHGRDEIMAVNALAPVAVTEALMANVARTHGRIVLMSSQLGARRGRSGSLGDYGDSKAALNDAFRARAKDWADRGVIAIVMHPGWVRTDMGGAGAAISVQDSAAGIRKVIEQLSPRDHGTFLTWRGEHHPW